MIRLAIAFLLCATMASAAPRAAVPATLDPAQAYILVEIVNVTSRVAGMDNLVPGSLTLARYDDVRGDVRGGTRSPASRPPKGEPVRVTMLGKPLVKEKTRRLFFLALPADLWVIEGSGATAFSLGSRTVRLEPGRITDLGVFSPSTDWREGEAKGVTTGDLAGMALLGPFAKRRDPTPMRLDWHARSAADMAVPDAVRAHGIAPAAFAEGARFGNYLGGLVNRIDGRAGRAPLPAPVE